MQVLDLRCPQAFDELDAVTNADNSTSIEINVDKIDNKTFFELDSYVRQKLQEKMTYDEPADTQVVEKKSKSSKSSNGRKSA